MNCIPIDSHLYAELPFQLKDIAKAKKIVAIKNDSIEGSSLTTLFPTTGESILSLVYTIVLSNGIHLSTSNMRIITEVPCPRNNPDGNVRNSIMFEEQAMENGDVVYHHVNKIKYISDLKSGDYIVLSNGYAVGMSSDTTLEKFTSYYEKYDSKIFEDFSEANIFAKKLLIARLDPNIERFGSMWDVKLNSKNIIKLTRVDYIIKQPHSHRIRTIELNVWDVHSAAICCDIFFVLIDSVLGNNLKINRVRRGEKFIRSFEDHRKTSDPQLDIKLYKTMMDINESVQIDGGYKRKHKK